MLDGLYRFQEDSNYLSTFSSVEFTCSAKIFIFSEQLEAVADMKTGDKIC